MDRPNFPAQLTCTLGFLYLLCYAVQFSGRLGKILNAGRDLLAPLPPVPHWRAKSAR